MAFLIILLYFIVGVLVAKATVWLFTAGDPSSYINDFDDDIDCIGTTAILILFFPVILAGMVLVVFSVVGYSLVVGFASKNPLKEYMETVKENLEKNKEK